MQVLTQRSTQQPETVAYYNRNHQSVHQEMEVGMGATMGVGSDRYPYTVWGWRVTKGGRLTVFVTRDSYEFIKAADWTEANQKGEYVYTSNEPSSNNPATVVNMSKKDCRYYLGVRRYYNDPSF